MSTKVINKADEEFKRIANLILTEGRLDKNPRPVWENGIPAHTLSINGVSSTYDLANGEFPLMTLRPVVVKSAIKELIWIYVMQSNKLEDLHSMGVKFWDEWDIGDGTIGQCYGATVRRHDLINTFLKSFDFPDSRYHGISLWQSDDFKEPHGLKPCCFLSWCNVRHEEDGDYLDSCLFQRSADFLTAASTVNIAQYAVFNYMVTHILGYKPGKFTWFAQNVQIYDRHVDIVKEMMKRESVEMAPTCVINPEVKYWADYKPEDIQIVGYDIEKIKAAGNTQFKIPVAV